ncbi:hypothetical protein GCN78_21210 [Janthinobacterium rivuli]|uniref:hypothetical protein n=1 Tax=Janthinobacterium sp. FT68W TaxID=2654255 RepID=UPI001264BC94|nr:hypothetical protein [Janthinobacterium sp. FT68W]KAB8047915.1 hypothetical protein GCN78_21210 [Janthinobacterium sp. FT68W]
MQDAAGFPDEQLFRLKGVAAKTLETGVAATVNGMDGALANVGLVKGKAVCGLFDDANKLKNDDLVKLGISERGKVLRGHSLLHLEDSLPSKIGRFGDVRRHYSA